MGLRDLWDAFRRPQEGINIPLYNPSQQFSTHAILKADVEKAGLSTSPRAQSMELAGKIKTSDDTPEEKPKFFNEHSRMWYYYLNDATAEAKAMSELCQTTIDTLLIFTGLFGGVLASFIVDSRSELAPDAQKFILGDIRSILQGGSTKGYNPGLLAAWINGLWYTSLLLTLFAAILGGIAKAWFVKFATAASRQDADDAYIRWVLDLRRWYLQRVIAGMPLLLHTALLLFTVAFGLQAHTDDPVIGTFSLTLIGLGVTFYLGLTVVSIWNERVLLPINTPLTDLLVGINELVHHQSPRGEINSDNHFPDGCSPFTFDEGKDKHRVLATIVRRHILWSSNPLYIDTAVIEIVALPDRWLEYFIHWGVAKRCIERIKACTELSARLENEKSREHTLRNHLKALLAFHAWGHRHDGVVAKELSETLNNFVTGYLGRWNTLPEAVRPLVFSVRVAVFLDINQDFHAEETEDLSWELIHKHADSVQRLPFALAACRALSADHSQVPHLQDTSVLSVCLSTVAAAHIGLTSEWPNENTRKAMFEQGGTQLRRLFSLLVSKCESILLQHLKDFRYDRSGFSGTHEGNKESADSAGTVFDLAVAFVHRDPAIRKREISLASTLIYKHPGIDPEILQSALLHLALNDDDTDVRETCKEILDGMPNKTIMKQSGELPDSRPRRNSVHTIAGTSFEDWENRPERELVHVLESQIPHLLTWFENPAGILIDIVIPLTVSNPSARCRDAGRACLKACMGRPALLSPGAKLVTGVKQALDRHIFSTKGIQNLSHVLRVSQELEQFDTIGLPVVEDYMGPIIRLALGCRRQCDRCDEGYKTTCSDCPRAHRNQFRRIFEQWTRNFAQALGRTLDEEITSESIEFMLGFDTIPLALYWFNLLKGLSFIMPGSHRSAQKRLSTLGEFSRSMSVSNAESETSPFTGAEDIVRKGLQALISRQEKDDDAKLALLAELIQSSSSQEVAIMAGRQFLDTFCSHNSRRLSFPFGFMKSAGPSQKSADLTEKVSPDSDATLSPDVELEDAVRKLRDTIADTGVEAKIRAVALSALDTIVRARNIPKNFIFNLSEHPTVLKDGDSQIQRAWIQWITAPSVDVPTTLVLERLAHLLATGTVEVRCDAVRALAHIKRSYPSLKPWVDEQSRKLLVSTERSDDKSASSKAHPTSRSQKKPNEEYRLQLALVDNGLLELQQLVLFATKDKTNVHDKLRMRSLQRLAATTTQLDHRALQSLQNTLTTALSSKNRSPTRDQASEFVASLLVQRSLKPNHPPTQPEVEHQITQIFKLLREIPDGTRQKVCASLMQWTVTELKVAVLTHLSDIIPHLNNKDAKSVVMDLFSDRSISGTRECPFAAADAIRILKEGRWHHRQTVIELIATYHERNQNRDESWPPWSSNDLMSIIDELVLIAIEGHDYDLRPLCLELLVDVCQDDIYRRRVRGYRARLLPLLETRSLRSLVARVISSLCKERIARGKVAKWILRTFTTGRENEMEGLAELLSRLILDNNLEIGHEGYETGHDHVVALDHALFLLAPVLMMRPAPLHNFQYQFATALWGNYHERITNGRHPLTIPPSVTDWFFAMIFGKHVTKEELEEWDSITFWAQKAQTHHPERPVPLTNHPLRGSEPRRQRQRRPAIHERGHTVS